MQGKVLLQTADENAGYLVAGGFGVLCESGPVQHGETQRHHQQIIVKRPDSEVARPALQNIFSPAREEEVEEQVQVMTGRSTKPSGTTITMAEKLLLYISVIIACCLMNLYLYSTLQ